MLQQERKARSRARAMAVGVLAAAISMVGLVGTAGTAGATWPGGDGRIAFDSDVSAPGETLQIYSMRPDGSDRRLLTTEGTSGDPSWSPDGRRLAFDSDRDAPSRIYVMDASGQHVRDVNPDDNCSAYPSWSPHGGRIVFAHYPDPNCEGVPDIWIEWANGTHARPLTNTPNDRELKPEYAPDGTRIAFISHTSEAGTFTVNTIRPDGRDRRQITPLALDASYPDWSPDSRRLVVASNADRDNSNVYLVRRDGSGLRPLTSQTTGDATKAVFSPTGRSVLYSSNVGTDEFDLYVLDLRSHTTRRVTSTAPGGEYFSSWQPCGHPPWGEHGGHDH